MNYKQLTRYYPEMFEVYYGVGKDTDTEDYRHTALYVDTDIQIQARIFLTLGHPPEPESVPDET